MKDSLTAASGLCNSWRGV